MVSAVLSANEIRSHERCRQHRFGLSLITALVLHLAVFAGFINFSLNSEPPQLMKPASQVIKANLVMAPKAAMSPKQVKAPLRTQKPKTVAIKKQKPPAKKASSAVPKSSIQPIPLPVVEPKSEPEPVHSIADTQQASPQMAVVNEPVKQVQPRKASIAEESYLPPSSNVAYYHNPKPRYPSAAKRRGMEGLVELRVMVDSRGQPVSIDIKQSSGFHVLDREAVKAVWQWRFQPAKRAGMAVAGEVIVPVRYQLDSA